jgi:hypothetical protein
MLLSLIRDSSYKRAKSLNYKTMILEGPHKLHQQKASLLAEKILELSKK